MLLITSSAIASASDDAEQSKDHLQDATNMPSGRNLPQRVHSVDCEQMRFVITSRFSACTFDSRLIRLSMLNKLKSINRRTAEISSSISSSEQQHQQLSNIIIIITEPYQSQDHLTHISGQCSRCCSSPLIRSCSNTSSSSTYAL